MGSEQSDRNAMRQLDREKYQAEIERLKAQLSASEEKRKVLGDALEELVTVAGLRGDNDLPHPANDPKLWTARMQQAWDDAANALEAP